MPQRDLISRLGSIVASIDSALDTDVITDRDVLIALRESIRGAMRDSMIVDITDGGTLIGSHINSRFGADPTHTLIGQHLHEMGYRLSPSPAPVDLERLCTYCEHRYGVHEASTGCSVGGCACHARPMHGVLVMPRLRACVEVWPECAEGEFDPRCCRFPKSCSCDVYDGKHVTVKDLEPVDG